jgi:hypothetical protein
MYLQIKWVWALWYIDLTENLPVVVSIHFKTSCWMDNWTCMRCSTECNHLSLLFLAKRSKMLFSVDIKFDIVTFICYTISYMDGYCSLRGLSPNQTDCSFHYQFQRILYGRSHFWHSWGLQKWWESVGLLGTWDKVLECGYLLHINSCHTPLNSHFLSKHIFLISKT